MTSNQHKKTLILILLSSLLLLTSGCAKVGSERWCEHQSERPKGEWTMDDTAAYAKHCLLKNYVE